MTEIAALQQGERRGQEFPRRGARASSVASAFFRDLTIQMSLLEVATGFGGLVIVITGSWLVAAGAL